MDGEEGTVPEIAGIAALIGEPSRAELLSALLSDRALSATELANVAGVSKSTISAHLARLVQGGLVVGERQGRHRYFRLADPDVAQAIESLLGVALRTGAVNLRTGPADPALRRARRCYDHLAGELGVLSYDSLVRDGAFVPVGASASLKADLELSVVGEQFFQRLKIDTEGLRKSRRSFCRHCLDWSERRYHLAGALGAALLSRIIELGWARPTNGSRALQVSDHGEAALRRVFEKQNSWMSVGP